MKNCKTNILIFLAYAVPYVFLGMYGDVAYHSMWLYGLMIVAMAALGWYCAKTKRAFAAAAGNLLSVLTSCLCMQYFDREQWNYYFKAFPSVIRTLQFSGIMVAVQGVIWWLVSSYREE